MLIYGSISLVLWYGGKLVNENQVTPGILTGKITVFLMLVRSVKYLVLLSFYVVFTNTDICISSTLILVQMVVSWRYPLLSRVDCNHIVYTGILS